MAGGASYTVQRELACHHAPRMYGLDIRGSMGHRDRGMLFDCKAEVSKALMADSRAAVQALHCLTVTACLNPLALHQISD